MLQNFSLGNFTSIFCTIHPILAYFLSFYNSIVSDKFIQCLNQNIKSKMLILNFSDHHLRYFKMFIYEVVIFKFWFLIFQF